MMFTFDVAKGKVGYYSGLPAANDALIWIPILQAGLGTSADLIHLTTVSAVLTSGKAPEATGVGRQSLAGVTWDSTTVKGEAVLNASDLTLTAPTGDATAVALVCYSPDIGVDTDSTRIPLFLHDFVFTPVGTDDTVGFAGGLYRAVDLAGAPQ